MLTELALIGALIWTVTCSEPDPSYTFFPDKPDWYVLDIGDTGCELYGWPVDCGRSIIVQDDMVDNDTAEGQ